MTLRLSEACVEIERVGGKASRLSTMMQAGFPVKPGLVITTTEVESILENGVVQEITEEVGRRLNLDGIGMAVRSSAVGEDGDLSWAGQFTTHLFVKSERLADVLKTCAAARHSDVVLAYARTHGQEVPPLALVIQEMVDASAAGVLFTIDPRGDHQVMVIEAVAGVGESLVSGQREPRRLYVNAVDGVVLRTEGAVEPELSSEQIVTLCQYGRQLRELFGVEQDVEWAIERGTCTIFLNQSRDITTAVVRDIASVRARAIVEVKTTVEGEALRLASFGVKTFGDVLSDQNIAELITPHPCQMAFGLFTFCFAHGDGAIRTGRNEIGYDIGPELEGGFFHLVGGQPRCSIVHDACTYRIKGMPLVDYQRLVEYYLARIAEDSTLANYPEVVLYDQNPSRELLEKLFGSAKADVYTETYRQFFANFRRLEDELDSVCRAEFLPIWTTVVAELAQVSDGLSVRELADHYHRMADLLRTEACRMFVKAARVGFFAYARLRKFLVELFGEDGHQYLNILTGGIPPESNPNLRFSMRLAELRDGQLELSEVVVEFGHLAGHELEISVPRYREQPELLRQLAERISGDPETDLQMSTDRARKLTEQLLTRAGTRAGELAREIKVARTYLPLREVVKFYYLQGYDLLRRLSKKLESTLRWEEGLIFHLDPREVFTIADQSVKLREQAERRRLQHQAYRSLYIPPVLFTDRLEELGMVPEVGTSGVLRGVGVTNQVCEGEVVVIENLDDKEAVARLHVGSVLVTVTTDPAWSPMLSVVGPRGGLVTEVGGLLAHGAIYARDMGIAAVLNVPQATTLLQTGMRVRVNGPAGAVEILKK